MDADIVWDGGIWVAFTAIPDWDEVLDVEGVYIYVFWVSN